MNDKDYAIGIYLGLNNICFGVWINYKVYIIPNNAGESLTPAMVAFTEREILIGESAK